MAADAQKALLTRAQAYDTVAYATAIPDVTGLQAALDDKADAPVAIADVTGLQAALDAKADA